MNNGVGLLQTRMLHDPALLLVSLHKNVQKIRIRNAKKGKEKTI